MLVGAQHSSRVIQEKLVSLVGRKVLEAREGRKKFHLIQHASITSSNAYSE